MNNKSWFFFFYFIVYLVITKLFITLVFSLKFIPSNL